MTSFAIDPFATSISVRRTEQATTFVNGIAQVVSDVSEFELTDVSVQPMRARERLLLPELIRDRETLKVYTKCALRSVGVEGKVRADRCTYLGEDYVVQSVENWTINGGYWKAVLVKEND